MAVAAVFSTALATGCCELDDETRRVRERPVIHANAGAQRIDFLSVLTDYHMGNIETGGKLGGRIGLKKDNWYVVVEATAGAEGATRTRLGRGRTDSIDDRDEVEDAVDTLGVETCPHPSGKALVFRITGTKTEAMQWRDETIRGGAWHVVYGFEHSAAMSSMRVPVSEASTCEAAAARFPDPLRWLEDELAISSKPGDWDFRRVAILTPDQPPPTEESGIEEAELTNRGCGNPVGYIVATEEGLLLEKAFDWALRCGDHRRIGLFRKALADGTAGGLERHLLSKLEPHETTPKSNTLQNLKLDEIVPALRDQDAQREAVDKVTAQCALADHRKECRAWRLRMAARIAEHLRDQARCDGLLALLPTISPDLGTNPEPVDINDSTIRELHLLRASRRCASPAAVRAAAAVALGDGSFRTYQWEHCEIDPRAPSPADKCEILPFYAASILVSPCHPDGIKAAHASLKATDWQVQQASAACVIGRCEGKEAYRHAIAEAKIGGNLLLLDDCGLDPSFAPDGRTTPAGSSSSH